MCVGCLLEKIRKCVPTACLHFQKWSLSMCVGVCVCRRSAQAHGQSGPYLGRDGGCKRPYLRHPSTLIRVHNGFEFVELDQFDRESQLGYDERPSHDKTPNFRTPSETPRLPHLRICYGWLPVLTTRCYRHQVGGKQNTNAELQSRGLRT